MSNVQPAASWTGDASGLRLLLLLLLVHCGGSQAATRASEGSRGMARQVRCETCSEAFTSGCGQESGVFVYRMGLVIAVSFGVLRRRRSDGQIAERFRAQRG